MSSNFQKLFEVHSYEVMANQKLNPASLIDYLNDIAEHHSESLGYSMETLFKNEFSWIVLNWNICLKKLPILRDIITIETWISQVKRCFAFREFVIKDSQNKEIIRASSQWIFYHLKKQRSTKIPLELSSLWPINPDVSCPFQLIDSDLFNNIDYYIEETEYSIHRQDIDFLEHVHNSRYIDWIIDNKPDFIAKQYYLKHLQVFYKHELKYPSNILIKQKIFPQQNRTNFLIHDQIWLKNENFLTTEVFSLWEHCI